MKIAIILLGEGCKPGFYSGRVCSAAQIKQLLVAGIYGNYVIPIGIKKTLKDETLLIVCQITGGFFGKLPVEIFGAIISVIIQLADENRGKVECHMDVRIFLQNGSHVVIIFCGVDAHPGASIYAGIIFVIQRLMLMPDQIDVQNIFTAWMLLTTGSQQHRENDQKVKHNPFCFHAHSSSV